MTDLSDIEVRLYVECVKMNYSKEQSGAFFESMDEKIDFEWLNILREQYGKERLVWVSNNNSKVQKTDTTDHLIILS